MVLKLQSPSDLGRLLSTELMPPQASTKSGSELSACHALVASFVDLERHLEARVGSLVEEVRSHQQHISMLKQELSEACRREISPLQVGTGGSTLLGGRVGGGVGNADGAL